MILKRVLPVIASIAVLCCMMIVPASAATHYVPDFHSTMFYSWIDVCADVYFNDGSVLTVDLPTVLPASNHAESSEASGEAGALFYYLTSEYLGNVNGTDCDALKMHFSVDPGLSVVKVVFYISDFVMPIDYNYLQNCFALTVGAGDSISASFKVVFVDEEDKPRQLDFSSSHKISTGEFNLFGTTDAIDKIETYNPEPGSYLLVSDAVVTFDCARSNFLFYSLYSFQRDYVPSMPQFLFGNGLAYERPIYENVGLHGFADFLADGVGAFMDTPIFGDIGIGTLLSVVLSVFIVMILIKMFAN